MYVEREIISAVRSLLCLDEASKRRSSEKTDFEDPALSANAVEQSRNMNDNGFENGSRAILKSLLNLRSSSMDSEIISRRLRIHGRNSFNAKIIIKSTIKIAAFIFNT